MSYIDAFITAVPNANKETYLEHAQKALPLFKKYGALRMVENWGDDVPDGELTSFPMAVKCKSDESIVVSWLIWPSRAVRDHAWQKLMEDPLFDPEQNPMPFDGSRMIYGGFTTILDE